MAKNLVPLFMCLQKFSETKFKSNRVIYLRKEILRQHDTQSAVLLLIMFIHVYNEKGQVWQEKDRMYRLEIKRTLRNLISEPNPLLEEMLWLFMTLSPLRRGLLCTRVKGKLPSA